MGTAIVMIVAGVAVAATGILGLLERLPRNRLVGVRTTASLRSDQAFTVANRAAGPATILGGGAAVISGVLALLIPAPSRYAYVLIGAIALGALAIVGGVRGSRAADREER